MATMTISCCLISSASSLDIDELNLEPSFFSNDFFQDMDIGLRYHLDSNRFDGFYQPDGQEQRLDGYNYDSQLRRARLSIKLPISSNWSSKLQVAINEGDNSFETKDMYLRYKGFKFADIKIGQSKEPFGLENLTSSANTLFTERALSTFALGRGKGINFSDANRRYSWSIGNYKVEQNGKVKADGDKAYTARVTFSPVNKDNSYNHFGIAYTNRNLQGAEYEIKTNGGVDNALSILDTKNIATNTIVKQGVEAAWGRDRLSFQGEYQHLQINATNTDEYGGLPVFKEDGDPIEESASYQGYYTQLSYFLTDDHRPYKKGRFSSVKPNSKKGAWELTFRKSALQSVEIGTDNKNSDIDIKTTVLGINYYLSKRIKFMLNAIDTEATGLDSGNSGSALSLRLQLRL